MIETSSVLPRKSSAIFGNLRKSSVIFENSRKMFGNVRVTFGQVLENLRKSSESGRKSSENRQKRLYQYVYIIKRTLHVSSKIWILCSRGKTNISLFAGMFLPLEHKIHLFFLQASERAGILNPLIWLADHTRVTGQAPPPKFRA